MCFGCLANFSLLSVVPCKAALVIERRCTAVTTQRPCQLHVLCFIAARRPDSAVFAVIVCPLVRYTSGVLLKRLNANNTAR